jgi:hypothetical protein
MTRRIAVFFLSSIVLAGSVRAQSPKPPAPEAKPLVVAGVKLDLDAREPRGLLLKGGKGESGLLRVEWGALRQKIAAGMASLSGLPADRQLSCAIHGGENICHPGEEAPWWAEVEGAGHGHGRPALLFSPNGQFYHYQLNFPASDFEVLRSALAAALGAPLSDQKSKVKNGSGGDYEQRQVSWKLRHTAIVLQQRYPGNLEESAVTAFYIPIAETTQ